MGNSLPRPGLYAVEKTGQVFAFEKLKAEIDLPCKGLIWPSLKTKLQLHIAANGGAIFNSLRWAARYGADSLLQNVGAGACDDLRIYANRIDPEVQRRVNAVLALHEESIVACALVNGCDEMAALEIILSIGARLGAVNGWSKSEEKVQTGKRRA